ncbi:MAG TPA: CHAT domain-containing protein [Thermoanaerobaculia bacterium]|nr:CHAT domain-containing protein [Thermoanaerobaculia bacterium]
MKKLAVIVITLCTFTPSCKVRDTDLSKEGVRAVEPRLSTSPDWKEWRAPANQPTMPRIPCRQTISTYQQALDAIVNRPGCIDASLDVLEELAKTSAEAMSDVAATYYIRARNEGRPADLLDAWSASEQAILAAPRSPAARFNRALIQEDLGLTADAMATWNELAITDASPWGQEARQHYRRLAVRQTFDGLTQWPRDQSRLAIALTAGDRATVEQLIERLPSAAQRYLHEELLPQCVVVRNAENLAKAKLLAGVLSKRFMGDLFDVQVVDAIERASPEQLEALAQGHLDYQKARREQESFRFAEAVALFESASRLFQQGGSPFSLRADAGRAAALVRDYDGALTILDPVILQARVHGYERLLVFAKTARANALQWPNRYIDSLVELDSALAHATRLRDHESLAMILTRKSGTLGSLGHEELAFEAALAAMSYERSVPVGRQRHALYGEIGAAALALDHPGVALLYQNLAVERHQYELTTAPPDQLDRLGEIRTNLAVALRERAKIKLALRPDRNDQSSAIYDLKESQRLLAEEKGTDQNVTRILEARAAEIQGQISIRADSAQAIGAFTRAINLASVENRTFLASLYAQRADAHRRAKHTQEAKNDLITALAELRAEELRILEQRQRGRYEELWNSYFSRFPEAYQTLIGLLMDDGEHAKAFQYAERVRAFEPLDLILSNDDIPQTFRELAGNDLTPPDAQRRLPPGTFLVQYSIEDERTHTWILSNRSFVALTQRVGHSTIERWTSRIQNGAPLQKTPGLNEILTTAYDQLIALPLAAIAQMPGGREIQRLVIVPDGAMHGLPIVALRDRISGKYLIERVPIEFAGSTKLYINSLEQNARLLSAQAPSVLAIGNPAFDETLPFAKDMDPIPSSEQEATEIDQLYKPNSLLLTKGAATAPEFFAQAPNYTIVHIAAHALVNARVPSQSLLLLAPSNQHNGLLTASELLINLHLDRTRLVVLAACSSAGGRPVGLEGVAPLVRPLLGAGVPAVIGSLWDVNDTTSKQLMVSFYRGYQASNDAAVALQAAQIEMLENNQRDPESIFAWAPFQVIGHTSPLERPASNGGTNHGIRASNSLQRSDRIHPQ